MNEELQKLIIMLILGLAIGYIVGYQMGKANLKKDIRVNRTIICEETIND